MKIYIATGFLDGRLIAARAAADLAILGIEVPEDARWWEWPESTLPVESDYMQRLRLKTLVTRAEHAISRCGRILVLLTDACGIGTGYEIGYAKVAGLPIYWMDCGRTKEIPPVLAKYGVQIDTLEKLKILSGCAL